MKYIKLKTIWLAISSMALLNSCTATRFVSPLKEKEHAIQMSLGGPTVSVPGVGSIPLPITNLTYGYGKTENLTLFGSLYPSGLAFGVLQLDAGALYKWNKQDNWGITTSPMLNFAIDKWEANAKLWPNLDINYYYTVLREEKSDWMFYGGFNNWFELSGTRVHDVPQPINYILAPHLGTQLIGSKWNFGLEFKVIAPGRDNVNLIPSFGSIAGETGSNSILLTLTRKF